MLPKVSPQNFFKRVFCGIKKPMRCKYLHKNVKQNLFLDLK